MKGGKRSGAGRKPGSLTTKTQEIAARVAAEGQTPLEYLLEVMRDPMVAPATRLDAAKAASPFCHPRLASQKIEIKSEDSYEDRLRKLNDEQLETEHGRLEAEYKRLKAGAMF